MQFRRRHGDIAAAVTTLALSGLLLFETTRMSARIVAYPRLLASILIVAGLVLLYRALRSSNEGDSVFGGIAWSRLLASAAVWGGAIYFTTLFGFYPVIGAMIACLLWILEEYPVAMKSLARIIAFGVAAAVSFWLTFDQLLNLPTPRGVVW